MVLAMMLLLVLLVCLLITLYGMHVAAKYRREKIYKLYTNVKRDPRFNPADPLMSQVMVELWRLVRLDGYDE